MDWVPDIFSFLDYRAFLRAYYDAAKANVKGFSYRSFAADAGLSSQSFLRDVIRGDKNIGGSLDAIAAAIGLDRAGHDFFGLLVAFDQASGRAARNELFEQIAATKRFQQARRIDAGMYQYLSKWYVPAIRELAAHAEFRDDPAWIARTLRPEISVKQASDALAVLLDLGFFVRGDAGLEVADPTVTTGHEVSALGVENYHHEMLRLAGESIARFPAEHRDLAAMTVCVSPRDLPEIKKRIHAFREQVLRYADDRPNGTVIVQFNSQLFPLTKVES